MYACSTMGTYLMLGLDTNSQSELRKEWQLWCDDLRSHAGKDRRKALMVDCVLRQPHLRVLDERWEDGLTDSEGRKQMRFTALTVNRSVASGREGPACYGDAVWFTLDQGEVPWSNEDVVCLARVLSISASASLGRSDACCVHARLCGAAMWGDDSAV
jgi:hypothetical protein